MQLVAYSAKRCILNLLNKTRGFMAAGIRNRFEILLSEKEKRERRRISLLEIHNQTGLNWRTLQSWSNNTVTRFDSEILIVLCEYFECDLCDLLQIH